MITYLFDASAVVHWYTEQQSRAKKIIDHIVEQRLMYKSAALFIPTFCVAEVFNTFAKLRFDPDNPQLTDSAYQDCLNKFRKDIHWSRVFYPYDLNRYHVLAADDIIPIEHKVFRRPTAQREAKYDRLSTFDILLIAMASELAYIQAHESVILVTADSRIKLVSVRMSGEKLRERSSLRMGRGLDEPEMKRWTAPMVFDIHHDDPRELPRAQKQKPLNLT